MGEVALNAGDSDRAVDFYDSALRYDDTLSGPYYRLAQHALARGQYQKTRAYLLSELRNNVDDAELLVSMGSMFLHMAGQQPPTTEFGGSVEQDLKNTVSEPDLDHAMHCLFQALDLDDRNAYAYYYLAMASAFKGYWDDACDFFNHVLNCNPDHVPALMGYAKVNAIQGHFDAARKRLSQVAELSPHSGGLRELRLEVTLRQTVSLMAPLTDQCKHVARHLRKKLGSVSGRS